MTTHITEDLYGVVATVDLSAPALRYKIINLNGTLAAGPNLAAGILKYGANSGGTASAITFGITKAFAGAAVGTVGYPLTVTTSGYLIAASSGGVTIGRALATCASGDIVSATVDFRMLGASVI
jgi:hypothetical protein